MKDIVVQRLETYGVFICDINEARSGIQWHDTGQKEAPVICTTLVVGQPCHSISTHELN